MPTSARNRCPTEGRDEEGDLRMNDHTRPFFPVLLILAAFAGSVAPAWGQAVIFVDASATGSGDGSSWANAYTSVQPALNAATSGKQVWVGSGRYVGKITLKLGVALYGGFAGTEDPATFDLAERDFAANETILDGNRSGSVVTAPPGATATTRIDGFTITNGTGTPSGDGPLYGLHGGGLYASYSSPTIANNTITGNTASVGQGRGGGVYVSSSSPTITNNSIRGNTASNSGGGLELGGSSATVANNTITGNSADDGGGLSLSSSSPTIANNTITGNSADDGGGLYVRYFSSPTIANNTIASNSASSRGGGLFLVYHSSATIANNAITGNTVTGDYGDGGGLSLYDSSATIANNSITGNTLTGSGGFGGGLYLSGSSAMITNNSIRGNTSSNSGGGLELYDSSPTIANNTITGNSASFAGGGLSLAYSSPAITNNTVTGNGAQDGGALYVYSSSSTTIANTIVAFNSSGIRGMNGNPALRNNCVYGNTAYNYLGLTDPTGTDGNISADPHLAELAYGNTHLQPDSPCANTGANADAYGDTDIDRQPRIYPEGGTVDIGADESDGTVWPPGPYGVVRVRPDGDDAHEGSSWDSAKRTVQAGIDAASTVGGEVWVQAGTYAERITLHPYAHVYGGFAGGETERDARDWRVNVTVLDGQQQGSVVTVLVGEHASTLDGFTITNGTGTLSDTNRYGGGLYLDHSSATIANNTITGNTVTGSYGCGGGLYLCYASPTIANNTITGNGALYGGGLYLTSSSPAIANNTITGNGAPYGGGLYLYDSSATIANNTISGNSASFAGGGLYLPFSSPTIANNTITGNDAPYGGAMYLDSPSPMIANNIIAFNTSGVCRTGGTPTLRCNCVYGNTAYNYSGLTDPTGTDGNISADPRFVQYPSNLHLLPDSPCLDAGDNAAVPADAPDLDGDGDTAEPTPYDLAGLPRFVDDPATPDTGLGAPPIVDMGAYEYQLDCNTNGILDADDISGGTSLDCQFNGIPDECDLTGGTSADCNSNTIPDECDIAAGTSADCQPNRTPDECEVAFDHNCCATGHGAACSDATITACVCAADRYCCLIQWDDVCVSEVDSLACGTCALTTLDCNTNGTPDDCEPDCNYNGTPDDCDLAFGTSTDADTNGIPDECEVEPCPPAWTPGMGLPGLNSFLVALTTFDDGSGRVVVAGGYFTTAGGVPADRVAQWNGTEWSALGTGMSETNVEVYALGVFDDGTGPALFAGGNGLTPEGLPTDAIVKWDGAQWSALGSGITGTPNPECVPVTAFAVFDDGTGPALVVGGCFTEAGGVPANNIAKWNGTHWSALDGGVGGMPSMVRSLAAYDSGTGLELVAGGRFTLAGGVPANNIAKWDGTHWSALGTGIQGDVPTVYALAILDVGSRPVLIAGGSFTTAGGVPANNIARWDGTHWTALAGGIGGHYNDVAALTVFNDGTGPALFAGGLFDMAGEVPVRGIAKWHPGPPGDWSTLGLDQA
jgi:parallel beta-helix repeat protein